jgi:hypothetical protein
MQHGYSVQQKQRGDIEVARAKEAIGFLQSSLAMNGTHLYLAWQGSERAKHLQDLLFQTVLPMRTCEKFGSIHT